MQKARNPFSALLERGHAACERRTAIGGSRLPNNHPLSIDCAMAPHCSETIRSAAGWTQGEHAKPAIRFEIS